MQNKIRYFGDFFRDMEKRLAEGKDWSTAVRFGVDATGRYMKAREISSAASKQELAEVGCPYEIERQG